MCGIAGILNSKLGPRELEQRLTVMQGSLHHRGPDDRGLLLAQQPGTGFVHTRLSILDLSPAGHQPMASADGRLHIVFNGEIYNFNSLRDDLIQDGETFVSHSDTEVILKMYARYGPDCVREFEGMFAFAIWDERERTCFLARGPLGIKPLYYFQRGAMFTFASEVRTILASDLVPRELAPNAVRGYLLFGAVPEPETLIENVFALPPGHYLLWKEGDVRIAPYWTVHFDAEPFTPARAAATVRDALEDSVRRHFVSDVPVGIFLSGGIDSSALVALASKHQGAGLRTFCISFDDPAFDEGDVARRTAEHFGAQHFDLRLEAHTAKKLLHEFLARSDQPSIDGFNTFCVSKHAHENGAKVVLSGLGGDELFSGYPSFQTVPTMVKTSRFLNPVGALRQRMGHLIEQRATSPRARRAGSFLAERPTTAAAYWCMRGIFTPVETDALMRQYFSDEQAAKTGPSFFHVPIQPSLEDEVSYLELTRYMRNQLLRDSDVMSMAWGLELRVPFVDCSFVSAISRIPAELRLAPGKKLLLDAIPEIPEWVRNRRKQGFVFPFRDWVTGEWKDVFERIDARSPVNLQTWSRRWCIFALENFLSRNGVASDRLAAAA
jgi:asparagine synthase (glutamine-hydrolysing)